MAVLWAWNAGGGAWLDYDPVVAAQVEAAHQRSETLRVEIAGHRFLIDPRARTQVNEASGTRRELRRVDPAEAAVIGRPSELKVSVMDYLATEAGGGLILCLRELENKAKYVTLRIAKASRANRLMAWALLAVTLLSLGGALAVVVVAAMKGQDCHCERGGVGYRDFGEWCNEGEVQVCSLAVERLIMLSVAAGCGVAVAALSMAANPPRSSLLRELSHLRLAVAEAKGVAPLVGDGSDSWKRLDTFAAAGHELIDAADSRVRVDKWTRASVRADWRAFFAQGPVTRLVCRRIRAYRRSRPALDGLGIEEGALRAAVTKAREEFHKHSADA